jgi:hypothetical protein
LLPDLAIVQPSPSGEGAQQRGFAGTVAANERNPFSGVELEVGMVEERHMAESKGGIGENQVGHGCLSISLNS